MFLARFGLKSNAKTANSKLSFDLYSPAPRPFGVVWVKITLKQPYRHHFDAEGAKNKLKTTLDQHFWCGSDLKNNAKITPPAVLSARFGLKSNAKAAKSKLLFALPSPADRPRLFPDRPPDRPTTVPRPYPDRIPTVPPLASILAWLGLNKQSFIYITYIYWYYYDKFRQYLYE
mgnify:CR=1 FL=1